MPLKTSPLPVGRPPTIEEARLLHGSSVGHQIAAAKPPSPPPPHGTLVTDSSDRKPQP